MADPGHAPSVDIGDAAHNVVHVNGASMTTPDGAIICARHGNAWGADPTCHRCTFKDGTPRLVSEPAYLSLDEFTRPVQPGQYGALTKDLDKP